MGEFKGIIYQVTNVINNKKYIGKSFTTTYNYSFERLLSRRKSQHKLQMLKENGQYFHRQLKKYGWDNFIWEIIDKSYNKHELNLKETFWIKNKNSYAPNGQGYNLTLGWDGACGCPNSEKARRLTSERSMKAIVEITTKKEYKSITDACKELGVTNSMVWAILNRTDNCIQTKGYSFAYTNEYYNNQQYYDNIAKKVKYRNSRNARKIINVNTKEIFSSALEASRKYGLDGSSILKCCKGNKRNPRCGGYVWRYLDEYENTEVS